MAKRKKYTLENMLIETYAAEGKCIARHDNKVIFVEGAVPGDVADLFVHRSKKDWAEAMVSRIVSFSPDRVDAFCSHFGICGGCKWQMLPYEKQLSYKDQQVKDQLRRIGKVEVGTYLPIKGSAQIREYRNKLEFTFSNKRYLTHADLQKDLSFDQNVVGFHAPRLFDKVIDIDTCHLQSEPTNEIRNFIRTFALERGYTFYDIRLHQGLLRTLIIRLSSLNEVLVNLVFGEDHPENIQEMMTAIQTEFPQITSLNYTINLKANDTIYDQDVICFSGKEYIEEKLEDFRFKISPKSFFQTNTQQATELYRIVREFAECKGHEILYDLYCGTGSIGIFLSGGVQKIIGVETVDDAIQDARINADWNGLAHAEFYTGDVIKICNDEFFRKHGSPDVVIIDPPRAGCHDTLIEKLLEMKAPVMVYVSCNPATQARDLQLLASAYEVTLSQAVDMFPHTHHIENVVQLKLKK
ncbi:MAG: 23S rRNA (uracil(1939)-C(5))-methyltransferase RlmD [Chitinophagaceae bacterium]|nr:23S rRNA (uracil(1939)-C(5))-methyltransferase RlmD [Chitinophagaceae bacterium]